MKTLRADTSRPVLEVSNLVKQYGKFTAVGGISLDVKPGEVVALLGPNGAGKTTTLKIIAGLLLPTSGEVRIEGVSVHEQPEKARESLGYVPDRPFVYERLTAREFMAFVADLYQMDLKTALPEGDRWLAKFGLAAFANERIEQYSHGMKQRLVMASAFFRRPRAMVIDEPMVGLDPRGARLVKAVFRSAAEDGAAILLSTHSLAMAEEVCDRAVILFRGGIVAAGNLADLRSQVGLGGAALEDVFLALTDVDSDELESVR
jgi:ABC-2 type transport system ATP-binding protein